MAKSILQDEVYKYDCHTLYVLTGVAYEHQLEKSLLTAIQNAKELLKRDVTTEYEINIVTNKFGNLVGYAYIWLSNPEIYYLLVGKNVDGTDREEWIDDPDWLPSPTSGTSCWADIEDERCPKVRRFLPPLLKLPNFKYDEIQQLRIKQIIEENNFVDESLTDGSFKTLAAFVSEPEDENIILNVLRGNAIHDGDTQGIPEWVTLADLRKIFGRFSSVKPTRNKIYPQINFNRNRSCFITYSPETPDAQFALCMKMKTKIRKMVDDKMCECTILFKHTRQSSPRKTE